MYHKEYKNVKNMSFSYFKINAYSNKNDFESNYKKKTP